jgi:hypothetical protein
MGLDMYAYKTKADLNGQEVDFSNNNVDTEDLHYWRKHPNLHGWMEELYYEKGGKDDSFNGSCVVLTEGDLDVLEEDIKNGNLPQTSGFFFGASGGEEVDGDLEFVNNARQAISEGYKVYYSSWW